MWVIGFVELIIGSNDTKIKFSRTKNQKVKFKANPLSLNHFSFNHVV